MEKYRASKLTVKCVPSAEEVDFLGKYHKQGYVHSEYAIGLYDGDKLLQIETFGIPRIEIQNKNIIHQWELLRECSKKDCIIQGGKSRLLKRFFEETDCLSLLSYCSLTEGFDGHSYAACGFTLVNTSGSYHYEYNGEKIQRYRMQKNANLVRAGKKENIQKTLEKYGKAYDPQLTEKENAERAGFVYVKDLGNQTWELCKADNVGYVYRTTNLINGKTYIGQHQVVKDGEVNRKPYLGSGHILKEAVKKYGRGSFKIETLEWTSDFEKLNDLEIKYIAEERAKGKGEYNILNGGQGTGRGGVVCITDGNKVRQIPKNAVIPEGWTKGRCHLSDASRKKISEALKGQKQTPETIQKRKDSIQATINAPGYVNPKKGKPSKLKGRKMSEEFSKKVSTALTKYYETHDGPNKGKKLSEEFCKKDSEALKKYYETHDNPFLGKTHSEETRKRISEKTKAAMANLSEEKKKRRSESYHILCQKTKEYLHSLGLKTRDDLRDEGYSKKYIATKLVPLGKCRMFYYY